MLSEKAKEFNIKQSSFYIFVSLTTKDNTIHAPIKPQKQKLF